MKPTLTIIIVTYNHSSYIESCLNSLNVNKNLFHLELLIIDNSSQDDTVKIIENCRLDYKVRLIKSNINHGFAKANNIGIKLARTKYVFILNPDTVLKRDTLSSMVKYLESHPKIHCLVPQLLNPDLSIQRSVRNFPSVSTFLTRRTPIRWSNMKLIRSINQKHFSPISYHKIEPITWALGGGIFARRSLFDKVGLFDERFFLYCEDIDWFYRLRKLNIRAYYFPPAKIIHHHLGVSDHFLLSKASFVHFISMFKFSLKHFPEVITGSYRQI